jgi:hypothetical protein
MPVWGMSLISEFAALLCISEFQIVMLHCATWFHFLEEFRKGIAVFIGALSHVSLLKDSGLLRWSRISW